MKYRMQILPMAPPLWNWPRIKAIALSISGNHSWRGCGLSGIACRPKWMNATNRLKCIDKFSMFEIFLWNKNHRSKTTAIRIFSDNEVQMQYDMHYFFSNFYVLLFNLFAKAPSNQFLFWSSWDAHSSVPENTPLFFCFWSIFREILSHRNNDVNKTLTCPSYSRVTFFKWKWITPTCFFTMEARSNFPKP